MEEHGKVTVFRFDPETDRSPRRETYAFPFEKGMSALDVALHVQERVDGSFTFSYCCRNSHCGMCGASINGRPGLLCREPATREMTLEPLDGLPVLRDLTIDRRPYEERMLALRLFLERRGLPEKQPERVDMARHARFKVVSRCVECYLCLSACPVFAKQPHGFLGPTGFAQLARHACDPRDEAGRSLTAMSSGAAECLACGVCDEVCPHGVSPMGAIQTLLQNEEGR